jgi:hypothetical protein
MVQCFYLEQIHQFLHPISEPYSGCFLFLFFFYLQKRLYRQVIARRQRYIGYIVIEKVHYIWLLRLISKNLSACMRQIYAWSNITFLLLYLCRFVPVSTSTVCTICQYYLITIARLWARLLAVLFVNIIWLQLYACEHNYYLYNLSLLLLFDYNCVPVSITIVYSMYLCRFVPVQIV